MKNKKVYKKNFITEALIRIDFNSILDMKSYSLKKLKDKLNISDLEFKEETVKRLELKLDKKGQSFNIMNISKSGTYQFKEGTAKFVLNHEKFLLSTNKYQRFSSFFKTFKTGFLAMQDLAKVTEFKRIGLRYINTIELEAIETLSDWKGFIKADFIPGYKNIKLTDSTFSLRRNMNLFVFGDGEFFVNIHTGIWNKNFPSKITDRQFILDIDCYIDNVILENDDILKKPKKMNDIAFKYFEFITTPKLKAIMEEQ